MTLSALVLGKKGRILDPLSEKKGSNMTVVVQRPIRGRTPGNGRGGLGRIRTDSVEILKKGQEPIRTKFHFFLKQPDPLSGRKSKFQDIRGDFISDRANPGKKNRKK